MNNKYKIYQAEAIVIVIIAKIQIIIKTNL